MNNVWPAPGLGAGHTLSVVRGPVGVDRAHAPEPYVDTAPRPKSRLPLSRLPLKPFQTTWCSQRTGAPSPAYLKGSSSSSHGLPRSLAISASRSVSSR